LLRARRVVFIFSPKARLGVLRLDFVGEGDYNLVITKSLHSLLHKGFKMTDTTYASSLGKCYAKSETGFYRLYKVDGLWTIYLVLREFSYASGELVEGKRLTATFGGYISDPSNFEIGVAALEAESAWLMANEA
jgi:hypothetical protein